MRHLVAELIEGELRLPTQGVGNLRHITVNIVGIIRGRVDRRAGGRIQDHRQHDARQAAEEVVLILRGQTHLISRARSAAQVVVSAQRNAAIGEDGFEVLAVAIQNILRRVLRLVGTRNQPTGRVVGGSHRMG